MLMMTNILEAIIIIIIISVVRSFCFLFEFDCVVANIKHKLSTKIHVNFEKRSKNLRHLSVVRTLDLRRLLSHTIHLYQIDDTHPV